MYADEVLINYHGKQTINLCRALNNGKLIWELQCIL